MFKLKNFWLVLALAGSFFGNVFGENLDFFCGAAVAVPMRQIIKNYEKETGNKINVIFGGSGTLLSQMELSRRGDVYLCGSPDYITIGERKNLLIPKTDRIVSYLVPAILVSKNNPKNIRKLEDLARPGIKVGMGNPQTVCLGLYGLEILDKNNLMEKVLPKVVVMAKSCEDTATLITLGKVDAILGWDVFESWNPDKVRWIKINPHQIPRLSYIPIALGTFVRNRKLAVSFVDYVINNPQAKKIWEKYGYITEIEKARKYAPYSGIGGNYEIPKKYREIIQPK